MWFHWRDIPELHRLSLIKTYRNYNIFICKLISVQVYGNDKIIYLDAIIKMDSVFSFVTWMWLCSAPPYLSLTDNLCYNFRLLRICGYRRNLRYECPSISGLCHLLVEFSSDSVRIKKMQAQVISIHCIFIEVSLLSSSIDKSLVVYEFSVYV